MRLHMRRAMEKENKWQEFGRLLKRYRDRQAFTQKELWEELKAEGIEIYDKSSISRWEGGKHRPSVKVIEVLEEILKAKRGTLLEAAGYLVQGLQLDESELAPVQQGRPISQLRQNRIDHFDRLAEIAAKLLASELDTVIRKKADLLPEHPTVGDAYALRYLIGKDENQREIRGRKISQMLMNNLNSVYDQYGASQLDSLACHLIADSPGSVIDEMPDPRPGTIVFEDWAVTNPFSLINTLRRFIHNKEVKGTCEICKDLKRHHAVFSNDLQC
jgi:transcriptional regulator with XRE-family HTH domain